MPTRVVTLRRWQIVAAFVAVVVAFSLSIVWAHNASTTAHRTAIAAERLGKKNLRLTREIVQNRRETTAKLHVQDVRSCVSRHKLAVGIRRLIDQSLVRALDRPLRPGEAATARARSIASLRRFLVDLRGADCDPAHVPPIGPIKPKTATP